MSTHAERAALVEALAQQLAGHARAVRTDVAEQIRAAFRAAGWTGPYLDASHLVGQLPPGVGGLPPDATGVLADDAGATLVDDAGVELAASGLYAAANHTHPGGGGGGMSNPMTAPADLIVGGAAGAPTRLGVGPADGQVLSAAAGAVAWLAPPATLNLLTNPGLEIWQRGNGPFTLHNSYTADGWGMQLGGTTTMSVTRVSSPVDTGSQYAAQLVVGSWSANANFWQRAENFAGLRNYPITYAVRVRATVGGAIRPWISVDGATAVFGSFHSGGGAFETLTVTVAVPGSSPAVSVGVDLLANGTFQVDNATLVVGSAPAAYRPLHTADELARCQRYYWEIGGLDANEFVDLGQNTSTTTGLVVLRYAVEMIAAPTVTVSAPGDWQVFSAAGGGIACTGMNPGLITRRSCRFQYTVASGLVAGDAALLRANSTVAARLRFDAPIPP